MKVYHLEEFPQDKIRVLFNEDYRKNFWKTLKSVVGSDEKIAKIVDYPRSTITKMKQGRNSRGTTYFIPLSMIVQFSKILVNSGFKKFSLKTIEKHVIAYKTWSASSVIRDVNLPLHEDERLVRIFTHLVGDGFGGRIYIKNDGSKFYVEPSYTNLEETLLTQFVEDLKVFGIVPYTKTVHEKYKKINIPFSVKYILEKIYGVEISASRGRFPKRFFKLSKSLLYQVIKAFCDDEGNVRDNSIVVTSSNKNQLEGMKKIMILADFDKNFITNVKFYRDCYSLKFYETNFMLFGKEIGFAHPKKRETLEFQIERHLNPAPTGVHRPTKKKVVKILSKNSYTSLQIAKQLGISQNWTGNYLRELVKEGKVEKFYTPGKNQVTYKLVT